MAREKGTLNSVASYVRERLAFETGAARGVAAEIARKTGFSTAHVANIKTGKVSAGASFVDKIATYWGLSEQQLMQAAMDMVPGTKYDPSTAPKPALRQAPPLADRRTEYDERFPNLGLALRILQLEGRLDPEYLDHIAQTQLKSPADLPVTVWLRLIDFEADARKQDAKRVLANTAARAAGRPSPEAVAIDAHLSKARVDAGLEPHPGSPDEESSTDR